MSPDFVQELMASGSCLRWSLDGGVQGGLVGRAVFCFYPLLGPCGASSPHQIRSDTNISDYVFFVYLFLGITALFSLNWLLITIKP